METGAFKQPGGHSLQLEFQDSNMSPAFSLLPVNSGVGHGFTDYSLVQQSDSEFAPLRAYPDDSVASEKFNILPRDQTTCVSDCGSLTQLPLGQTEILSDGGSNGFSISQHSLSPGDQSRREEVIHPPMMAAANEKKEIISRDYTDGKEEVRETQINASDKPVGEASEDETLFLSKDVSVQHLMKILQKDVGMSTNSSSAASSETSGKRTGSFTEESKFTKVCKLVTDQSIASRECPPGEASFPPQQAHQPNEVLNQPVQQQTLSLEVCNITMGSRSTKPDNDSEVLRRELLSEVERCKSSEGESKNTQQPNNTTLRQSLTEQVKAMSEGKPSVVKTNMSGAPLTGPFSAGVERVHREHDLWSSGNQTGIDGSYLNFLPQSQSTPGVFNAPPESTVKVKLGTLSSIQSIENNSYHASRGNAPQPLVPVGDTILSDTTNQLPECSSSAKVQSLPSLNYMQKVDAWRANHSSGNTSLFDSLALQGFSGISPKKKAYDAVSDHLNRILSQQIRSVQQPPVSEAANHSATQTSSATASGSSSPRRGEAVGSAPSDKDNTGATAPPSASPCGRSQSHSSLSTVVMSVQKDQQTERRPEAETTHCPDPTSKDQTPPHMSLGHFSDVSLDRDLTLSSSQDSHGEIKLGTSIGASSVSLELDNYVPYWNSKPSTPPLLLKPRELNIDERIPLYLHNLGIDQSPATILTPFAPRGPIREPEFSPTEFCTLKGSTGTPTKSTHPSEEWIKLKLSGQHCEPLQLDEEDRRQIDKIKRELLLKNPMNNLQSTDTESSAASSVKVSRECNPSHSAEACSDNNQPVQGLYATPPSSSTQRQIGPRPALEAQVCEIAAREGVTLPIKKPQTLTSITITTRRRSTSPSPSTSPAPPFSPTPDPLHLTELSRETDQPTAAKQDEEGWVASAKVTSRESPSVSERGSSSAHSRKRQDTLGGQYEEPLPPFQRGVLKKHESPQDFRQDNKIYVQNTSASASFVKSSVTTGHVSHVHFTVSPKAPVKTVSTDVDSSHPTTTSRLPCEEFTSLRCSSTATSSPDEGVGLSSLPEWCNAKESVIRHQSERSLHSSMFKTVVPKGRPTSMSTETFTPHHRSETPPRTFTTETPVPVLLPYKPPGSEELFYIPQTEADFSSTEQSDTTMESTHTGSDDAVPPNFGSEVLGHQDPGVDRGVTIRHTEGIYSKRQKTAAFTMQEPGHKAADKSPSNISPSPSSTTETLMSNDALKMDQGTSPVHFLQNEPEPTLERLQPVSKEADYDKGSSHLVPQKDWEQGKSSPGLLQPATQQNSLDQLWQKFCDSWTMEESRPTRDRESSLLERLERLSRLIHSTRAAAVSQVQKEVYHHPEQKHGRGEEETLRRMERMEAFEEVKRGGRKDDPPLSLKHQVEETSQCVEGDSHASSSSSFSLSSSQSQHLSPADRDESETLSTVSGSMSTVDTARLVQAFGADKIQHLKTKSSLSKLYSNIDRQKEGRQQRRGRHSDSPAISMLSETMDTDVSVAADTSSTSTYTLPPHQGPSRTLECKRAVRVANKSIQAGELEIVRNGTRRHTRDVGTVFPSPGESGQISSNSSNTVRGRGSQRSPSKAQIGQKQRKSRKSPLKPYPEGVSWFIPADDLRSEARKENKPMQGPSVLRRNTAWFEPYSKVNSWREPLRQRQIHEDGCEHQPEPHPDPTAKTYSGLIVSLQEALERHRPEFISRSRQRVKRLALQVEERKLQTAFTRNREVFVQLGEPERLPRPAGIISRSKIVLNNLVKKSTAISPKHLHTSTGAALLRRAVPRKEMIWRSKQIYDNLPEVRWRREEERRKADYQTYRLNAQLYNRRITNRVLGRRSAWQ
ncbi:uncharacterized protein alms1 isoform 3-T3 [Pholidichthys leucotaenia]